MDLFCKLIQLVQVLKLHLPLQSAFQNQVDKIILIAAVVFEVDQFFYLFGSAPGDQNIRLLKPDLQFAVNYIFLMSSDDHSILYTIFTSVLHIVQLSELEQFMGSLYLAR